MRPGLARTLFSSALLSGHALAAPATPDVAELLRSADEARHPIEEGVLRARATTTEEGEVVDVSVFDVFVQGTDHVLVVFREGLQKDRKILVNGDRTWLSIPGVAKPVPIDAGQRVLGGASITEIARTKLADFDAVVAGHETLDGTTCLVLELEAREKRAPFASGKLWIGEEDHLPRQAVFSLRSGREAKRMRFIDYERVGRRPVLRRMEVEHLLERERGTLTMLEFLDYEERQLEPELFDPKGALK